jgi:hypothetical protein
MLLAVALISLSIAASGKPAEVTEQDSKDKDLAELEAMLTGEKLNETAGVPAYSVPQIAGSSLSDLYAPPYADLFKNDSLFQEWNLLFLGGSVFSLENFTWPDEESSDTGPAIRHVIS